MIPPRGELKTLAFVTPKKNFVLRSSAGRHLWEHFYWCLQRRLFVEKVTNTVVAWKQLPALVQRPMLQH